MKLAKTLYSVKTLNKIKHSSIQKYDPNGKKHKKGVFGFISKWYNWNPFERCGHWYIGDHQYFNISFWFHKLIFVVKYWAFLRHPFVGAEASNGEALNRIFAERYNCRKRGRLLFQCSQMFTFSNLQFTLPLSSFSPIWKGRVENIVVKERNALPTPFPPQNTYKQFWSDTEFILFRPSQ